MRRVDRETRCRWFLLKLLVATAPRTLLTAELFVATMGPVSWLAMTIMAVTTPPGGPSLQNVPQAAAQLFGLFLAFGAIPRMVLGPVLVVIEGVTLLLFRGGVARALLVGGDVDGRCSYRPLRAPFCTYGPLLNVCQRSSGVLGIAEDGRVLLRARLTEAGGCKRIAEFFENFLGGTMNGPLRVVEAPRHAFADARPKPNATTDKYVSLINRASIRALEEAMGVSVDPIRFRANLYFDGAAAWSEHDWIDFEITLGAARLRVISPITRCAATQVNPVTAKRDRDWHRRDTLPCYRGTSTGAVRPASRHCSTPSRTRSRPTAIR